MVLSSLSVIEWFDITVQWTCFEPKNSYKNAHIGKKYLALISQDIDTGMAYNWNDWG